MVWFLVELNLISANIFGFAALSKELPRYAIYEHLCKRENGSIPMELDCKEQTSQYQVNIIYLNTIYLYSNIKLD